MQYTLKKTDAPKLIANGTKTVHVECSQGVAVWMTNPARPGISLHEREKITITPPTQVFFACAPSYSSESSTITVVEE